MKLHIENILQYIKGIVKLLIIKVNNFKKLKI